MKINIRSFVLFLSGLFLIHCGGPRIVFFHNDGVDFGEYRTFNIRHPYGTDQVVNERIEQMTANIEGKLSQEMQSRQYTLSDRGDLIVQYSISLNPNSQTDFQQGVPFTRGGFLPYYDPFFMNNRTYDFIEGVVIAELMDRNTRKLVWQASREVKYNPGRENTEEIIIKTINELFETYNYVAGKSAPVKNSE